MAAQRSLIVAAVAGAVAALMSMAVTPLASSAATVSTTGELTVARPVDVFSTTFLENPTSGARAGIADHAGHEVLAGTIDGDFGLARVQRGIENSFGNDDLVVTDFGGNDDAANAVALGDDGRVVAAGTSRGNLAVAQYDQTGELDNGFGSFGKVMFDLGGSDDAAYGVVVLADRRVLVAGGNSSTMMLWRLNADGSNDTSFGSAGLARFSADGPARGLVVQPDGRAVVVGGEADRIWARRVLPDGTPDVSFGQAGTASVVFGTATSGRPSPSLPTERSSSPAPAMAT